MACFTNIGYNQEKKVRAYKERHEDKRKKYLETIKDIPSDKLVYVDESAINEHLIKEYAYAPRGQKVMGFRSGKRFVRENFMATICNKKILAPLCFNGVCDTTLMLYWVINCLIPVLQKGQYVIMDNVSFHQAKAIKECIEA